ncbi:MAG: hypothetical protein RIB47_05965 [Cyclobacteriaceae bacterium]
MQYPEIDQLIRLQKTFNMRVEQSSSSTDGSFIQVVLQAGEHFWEIYIDNEYRYFNTDRQLVCLYLVLSALENYETAEDYLEWCRDNELDASDTKWLNYYRGLGRISHEVESIIGKIECFIASYDYEFRAGAFAALLTREGL